MLEPRSAHLRSGTSAEPVVTVFGGGGFIGRYVCQQLLKAGMRIRVAERDPKRAWFVKPLGGLGQTQFVAADLRNAESVARAIAGSSAVINLVGVLKGDLQGLHVDGPANLAQAAKAAGVGALVHISAIGADPESPSAYGRSKGEGEAAVRAAFPEATIIRPSLVFGPEDNFVNRFAQMARMSPLFLPVLAGEAKFQPVWVADLARAIAAAAVDPETFAGKTFELGGPQVMTMAELNRDILTFVGRPNKPVAVIPDFIGSTIATFGFLPGAPITADQWRMLQVPSVVAEGADGFEAFGIRPAPLAAVAERWLTPYRKGGRFAVKSAG